MDHALTTDDLRPTQTMGALRSVQGNLHQDLLNFEHAAHVYGEVLQRAKLNADFRATALNNRANAHRALGQFDRSLEGHHAALSLVRDQGLPLREPMRRA